MGSNTSAAPPPPLIAAFERLKEVISQDDARTFASTTMQDVWKAARDIEHQLEARRSLRGFRRLQTFLTGIEQYSKVIETLCNQTPYLPYVWVSVSRRLFDITHPYSRHQLNSFYRSVGMLVSISAMLIYWPFLNAWAHLSGTPPGRRGVVGLSLEALVV